MAVTQGTWGIGGFNLPDFGITEKLFPTSTNPNLYNPDIKQGVTNTTGGYVGGQQPAISQPKTSQPTSYTNTPSQSQPTSTGMGPGAYVGETKNGQRWTGVQWEPLGGWDNQGGGQPTYSGPSDEQINSIFAPGFENINAIEAQYQQNLPVTLQGIETSYAPAVTEMQNAQNTQIAGIGSQRTKGKAQEQSEIAKARRRYNELMQNSNAMYGGTSSIAQGSQELLGRATQEQMGDIDQSYGGYYRDLDTEEKNTNDFFANKKADLEKEKQQKILEAKQDVQNKIAALNTDRTKLQSEKANYRMTLLQEFNQRVQQAQFDAQVFASKLEQWKTMKDQMLTQAKQYQAKSVTVPGIDNVIGSFSMGGMNNGTNAGSNYATAQGSFDPTQYGYFRDPQTGKLLKIQTGVTGTVGGQKNWWE
jgi:hypothetical protein